MIRKLSLFLLLTLYIVAPAFSAKDAPTITVSPASIVLCNNGTIELYYTVCPSTWSSGALPAPAAEGWLGVTTAVDATGTGTRYDIGGGNNYGTDLADVPWGSLQAGDAVNIYYRATPYREKIPITAQGTATNPIIINGVTDASGNRPEINGENAVSVLPTHFKAALTSAVVLIYRKDEAAGGVSGVTAEHIQFKNIVVRNALGGMSYTHNGSTVAYPSDGARLVWIRDAQHITIEGCIFEDGGEGIFAQSPDDGEGRTRDLRIRSNWFKANGAEIPPSSNAHQMYLVAFSEGAEYNLIEGNFFDEAADPEIAQAKLRTTDTIFRYNTLVGNARMLDLVEAQDGAQEGVWGDYTAQERIDRYRTSYVYGNLFINDYTTGYQLAKFPIHVGWDTGEFVTVGRPGEGDSHNRGIDGGHTYFFNNTLHYNSVYASSGMWRGGIFELGFQSASASQGSLIAANNIIEFGGDLRGAHLNADGSVTYESTNLIYSATLPILAESDAYANAGNTGDDPATLITNNDTRITASANFVDPDNANVLLRDYSLDTGSPALNAATSLPAALSAYPVEYNPVNPATGVMAARSTTNHLGAFE